MEELSTTLLLAVKYVSYWERTFTTLLYLYFTVFWQTDNKDGYRQRNVRQFLQSAKRTIWLPQETHAGMSLPYPVLRVESFGYIKRV